MDGDDQEEGQPGPAGTFDVLAAWRGLPADCQEAIGAAALVHILGLMGSMQGLSPAQGYRAAEHEGIQSLEQAVLTHLPDAFDGDGLPRRPELAGIDVHACRGCGCTQDHACEGGCWWVEEDLCSTCAGQAVCVSAPIFDEAGRTNEK
ncbi:hypothetical protein [Azospirillum sp. B4]|uniref:hypothetical protein n=1 Tax=Azospirillum sp. B4 TaxID=95605 RepID=UPI000679A5F4|nr:hypothetical protein [Azospirillum sp. B4]